MHESLGSCKIAAEVIHLYSKPFYTSKYRKSDQMGRELGVAIIFMLVVTHQCTYVECNEIQSAGKWKEIKSDYGESGKNFIDLGQETDIHKINKNNRILRGYDIVEGKPTTRNGLIDEEMRWPEAIPLRFTPGTSLLAIGSILEAVEDLELKTCFVFVEHSDENDYLDVIQGTGCYSSVGRQGGSQPLSIGTGCEVMNTVEHEIFHALGFYHEQSRTFRDDYVTINWQNIEPGQKSNFDDYGQNVVNPKRVPYDFYSLMHYDQYAFSINGEPTITTKDAYFSDIIGSAKTVSSGDLTKLTRMYDCGETKRYSYVCNFEDPSICGFVPANDTGWRYHKVADSYGPFPQTDNTYGELNKGSVVMAQQLNRPFNSSMSMHSPLYETKSDQQCLEFSYYASSSTFNLSVSVEENGLLSHAFDIVGVGKSHWETARATMSATSDYNLLFTADLGYDGVIAIDDVSVVDRACDTSFIFIQNFSQVLNATAKGKKFQSDTLYTEDGYGFRISIFPNGNFLANPGYMSLFFSLAQGENDDTLQWPFSNHFVKLSVVDQSPDVLARQNWFKNFVTNGSEIWQQPTSEVSYGWGYRNFMKTDDILNKLSYLKHGDLMISVKVKDMNEWNSLPTAEEAGVQPDGCSKADSPVFCPTLTLFYFLVCLIMEISRSM